MNTEVPAASATPAAPAAASAAAKVATTAPALIFWLTKTICPQNKTKQNTKRNENESKAKWKPN